MPTAHLLVIDRSLAHRLLQYGYLESSRLSEKENEKKQLYELQRKTIQQQRAFESVNVSAVLHNFLSRLLPRIRYYEPFLSLRSPYSYCRLLRSCYDVRYHGQFVPCLV